MNRLLAGAFDLDGGLDPSRAARALGPGEANLISSAPLHLAYSGPAADSTPLVCLLDGSLDSAAEIERELGPDAVGSGLSPEGLLAAAYRRWGAGLLERMRGDFVLVLWDRDRDEGLIARDQLGVRPLFLHEAGRTVRFAGEIRQLLEMLPRRPSPDPAAVAHWIAVSRLPGTQTLYSGLRRLGPGEVLLLDPRGARTERYWAPRFQEPLNCAPAQLAGEIRKALQRSVRLRLSEQGPTGVLMSGGLDSSSIAAVAADLPARQVRAYSATFPDHPAADESELVAELRQTLGLDGTIAKVRAGGLLASALEHLAAWQTPLLSWGDFWVLELMRAAASEGVGTMLGGDGGDELFGPRQYLLADRIRAGHPLQALALAGELPGAGPHVPRRQVAGVLRSWGLGGALPYSLHSVGARVSTKREAPRWLQPRTLRDLVASSDPLAWKRLDGPRWWAEPAYGIAYGIEEAGIFEHQRRRADLAGVQARHPLLDLDLVSLGLRQPPRATLDRRFNRPVLRASMDGLLPDSVRLRPAKARFESLIVSCLTGPDAAIVRRILLDPQAELRAYLDQGKMEQELFGNRAFREHDSFRWMWNVWRLVTAELWLRAQASPSELRLGEIPSPSQVSINTKSFTTFSHLDQRA